ncbi:radical SAM protein [Desulfovibrio inopinatus]|uniref:radical SAM protein n=1 Tax=Desulfovibrio inopinatus TaxID=102109 RepID=UPI000418E7DC|nr:radical SAM protein [Desulfovibrio inopinatus]
MENIYSQAKIFHFKDRLDALSQKKAVAPIHIRLKPINACNHRCFYCCYRNEDLFLSELMKEKDMIPEQKMAEIAQDMIDCGVKAVTFTGGGEPLIYPHFVQTARTLLNGGVKVATLTNGSALCGSVAQVLAEGASWVRVSMDSTDGESIQQSRGTGPEEFDRIIANIEAFSQKKHRDCELGVNFIVTKLNAHKVYDFIKLLREVGADHVKVSECVVGTDDKQNNAYHKEHFAKTLAEVKRAQSELSQDGFRVINKFHELEIEYQKPYGWCPFICGFLNVIAADLRVYTCQDKAYSTEGILGSLKDQSLKEFWHSDAFQKAALGISPLRDCHHHCVQHGKNMALIDYLSTDTRHLEFV